MIDHYNAFISYKHAELDNKIAEHVQKKLEHFHIPAKIQKQTGKKKIERVFRDKDELPITSDLTETISYALEHADYLIVICSTNTKKSIWVKREIEFFLKTHDRSRILTVLCDGEPYDVIPEELTTQEKTVIDENGKEVTITTSMEPLSCDYREGLRKGDKEELPRLASAIIGCSYDELMNRRRQYKTRQMVLIFSLVISMLIALGSYFFWTYRKIQDSLKAARISQARYYAGESERLLEQDQRIKAIQLALMALPSEENPDCPIIPEAQRALTDSVSAYVTESTLNPGAVWSYSMSSNINAFEVSPNDKYLAGRDDSENIYVWDMETKQPIMQLGAQPVKSLRILFANDDTFVVVYPTKVRAYDVTSGKMKWETPGYYGIHHSRAPISEDGKYLILTDDIEGVAYIDIATGNVDKNYDYDFKSFDIVGFSPFVAYPNAKLTKYITLGSAYEGEGGTYCHIVGVVDTTTGEETLVGIYNMVSYDVEWISEDKAVIALLNDYNTHYVGTDAAYIAKDTCELMCIDVNTGEVLWNSQTEYTGDIGFFGLFEFVSNDKIALVCGDNYQVFDLNNGTEVVNCQMTSAIAGIADRHDSGQPMIITADGKVSLANETYSPGCYYTYDVLPDDLIMAEVHDVLYLVQRNSNEILLFDFNVYDENWNCISDEKIPIATNSEDVQYTVEDGVVVVVSSEENIVDVYDVNSDKKLAHVDMDDFYPDQISYPIYDVLGVVDGKAYFSFYCWGISVVASIDCDTGKYKEIFVDTESFYRDYKAKLCGNIISYVVSQDRDGTSIGLYDTSSGKTKTVELDSIEMENNYSAKYFIPVYFSDINSIFYVNEDGKNLLYNVETKKQSKFDMPDEWQRTNVVAVSPEGDLCLADNSRIAVFDQKGNLKNTIICNQGSVNCIDFYTPAKSKESVMLASTTAGFLCRYSTSDYSSIGSNKMVAFEEGNYEVKMNFDIDRNYLYINSKSTMSMIDMSSWYEVAVINSAIGHCNETDKIYTLSNADGKRYGVGYFKHYTIDELIQMGKNILGDYQFSDEEKASYGG